MMINEKIAKLFLIFIVLLAGCTSAPHIPPQNIVVNIPQPITIPSGATHLLFSGGTLGKGSRYQPYCRLDVKAPLEGEKKIQAYNYTASKIYQRVVRDDLVQQPAFFNFSFIGFLDEENVFNLFSLDLSSTHSEGMRLRCYQEFQSRFEAHPFLLRDINAIVEPFLSLTHAQ